VTACKSNPTIACLRGPQQPFLQFPSELAGFEDEQAYDAATNMIYAASHNVPSYMGYFGLNASTYFSSTGEGGVPCPNCGTLYNNATIWAINAATGAVAWHYNIPLQGYRGQIEVSGNMVFATLSSGDILMLNAATGQLVRDYYIGAPMDVGLSIGASVSGTEYLILPVGTCSFEAVVTCPGTTPGDVVALTLQNVPPASTSTATVTQTATSTTTTTTTSVSTTTAPGQVITTTITGPGGGVTTTTITQSGSAVTQTVTSTTGGSGVSSTTLYGVAAVAVIFIIATGYLAMRGRKPAS